VRRWAAGGKLMLSPVPGPAVAQMTIKATRPIEHPIVAIDAEPRPPPNPSADPAGSYIPTDPPAIGDLTSLFQF